MSSTLRTPVLRSSWKFQFLDLGGVRYKWKQRGKNPEIARTLADRLAELKYKDPALHYKVDIGFAGVTASRRDVLFQRIKSWTELRKNEEFEQAARNRNLHVPLDAVSEEWSKSDGPAHLKATLEYFNVYEDLFRDAYFLPVVPMKILFNFDKKSEVVSPVHRGNIIKPTEASVKPDVFFPGRTGAYYTLQMTTPDGHLTQEKGEYLHWLVGNIPGSDFSKGAEICHYLQPFPAHGIGFCRYIFILYQHDVEVDFSKFQRSKPCTNLSARSFSTFDFYKELQDLITPCGASFFQSDWDQNLTPFYQNVLEMPEPSFEYDFPPMTYAKQVWFPIRKPFNLYLDKHKDPKQLQKELLIEKLKETHPFRPPEKPHKYPLAFKIGKEIPSWLNDDIKKRRVREGKWKFM